MKRGFEENVPKVRPRVRLGRALDEQVLEAQEMAAAESLEPPIAPAVHDVLSIAPPLRAELPRPEPVRPEPARPEPVQPEAQKTSALMAPAPTRRPTRTATAAAEVAGLALELTTELQRASEANHRLKSDLDAALAGLRQAADESREQREETRRLAVEVDKRAAAASDLVADQELLEAERDGALSQVARLSRELREEKARAAAAATDVQRARAEAAQAREAAQRVLADLQDRTRERDEARAELLASRSDRDRLAEELLAASAEVEEAAQSRNALEEIHRALAEARSRIGR